MFTATIVSTVLALAPPTPPLGCPASVRSEIVDVEVDMQDQSAHLLAYEADGDVSSLMLWADDDGRLHFDADFPDGVYLSAVVDDETAVIDSNDAAEVAARVEVIQAYFAALSPEVASRRDWIMCGSGLLVTVSVCAAGRVLGCMGSAVATACACTPVLTDGECL